MSAQVPDIFATSSPLFACNFRLYSDIENNLFINNCFLLKKGFSSGHQLPRDIGAVLRILAENTMRVSELLRIENRDYLGESRWFVRGCKRSRDYVVTIPVIQLENPPSTDARWRAKLIPFTYNTIYRWCCRAGIGGIVKGRVTVARTHAHRYATAKKIQKIAGNRAAGDALHHNSNRAVNAYLR